MKDTVRVAVIGAGHLGTIHARLASQLPDAELVAVVDSNRAAADRAASECGTAGFSELEHVWELADAAIVATPTVTHEQVALALLERGVHVLVEKPLTDNVAGASKLVRVAEKNGRVLQVGHVERFNPAFEVAQSRIRDAKFIEARRVGTHAFRSTDIGVVHDLMIHDIDLVIALVNSRPLEVRAFGVSVLGDSEDIAQATIRFENGCLAHLVASRVSLRAERRLNVFTPSGFVGVDLQSSQVDTVEIGDRLRGGFSLSEIAPESRARLREELFTGLMHHQQPTVPERNAIVEEQRDFIRCVKQGAMPRVDGQAAVAALELAEQILHSIATHQWDATATGRVGPFGLSSPDILRDARFLTTAENVDIDMDIERRKAG